jgi:colanic acid/amylovoran biosynthesis glycosyltransferase
LEPAVCPFGYLNSPSYTEAKLLNSSQSPLPHADAEILRIAYFLSRYPAVSHTFFLKEVLGMRERGLLVEVASINPPDRSRKDLPEVEAAEADQTYYVKPSGFVRVALQILAIAVRNPGVTTRGLRAALRLGGWDLKSRAYAFFYLAEALLVGDWMRRGSLKHLHVHFGGAVATVGMLTAQAWQIPWSITLHGPDEFFDQDAFYLRQKIESAQFIVCISDFCRSQVLRVAPELSDNRLEVVRLGVDCAALQPTDPEPISNSIRNPIQSPTDPLRLVCTGRMVSAKGHRILLEALASMVASGIQLSCTLIGDGPERRSLEALCKRLDIDAQVRFLGAQAHHATLAEVAQADVFVLASFAEGLPVALMEAMALGVPCVSTTIAAIPELIRDGENGLLVPPANPQALQDALSRLANDPELRSMLGRKARATVEADYNLARNLDLLAATWVRRLDQHV